MIEYLEINGKRHPFQVGVRSFYDLRKKYPKEQPDTLLMLIQDDFEVALDYFLFCNKNGCERHKRDGNKAIKRLTHAELEEVLNDFVGFGRLMDLLNSNTPEATESETEGKESG